MGIERPFRATETNVVTRPRLRLVEIACGAGVAGVFLLSSLWHTSNPYYFLSSVYRYDLVGPFAGQAIAAVMPFLQLVVSFCLLGRVFVRGAFLSAIGLTTLFAVVQLSVLWRDLGISCGCFGAASDASIGAGSLTLVGSLLGMAIVGYACAMLVSPPAEAAEAVPDGAIPHDADAARQSVGSR